VILGFERPRPNPCDVRKNAVPLPTQTEIKNSNANETTALNVGMKKQTTVLTKKRKEKQLW
jgi:hypothetical protein